MSDREQILDLMSAYNWVLDAHDFDAWADCFSPDGVFEGVLDTFRVHTQKDEFIASVAGLESQQMPRMRHFVSNILIDIDDEKQSAASRCFAFVAGTPDAGPSSIALVGEYHDNLVKVDGQWLFSRRRIIADGSMYQRKTAR
jgi:3-phenylpropionate/cinnamic acid dioxygenase small subunit